MSWDCPECGETNRDDSMAVCVCGFNRDEPVDVLAVSAATQTDPVHQTPGHTRRVVWKIFKFVFVVHFVAWSVVMAKQTAGRPYVLARAVMTNAVVLTGFYIRPLRKILGPKNPLLTPLVAARDFIFDIGWELFPADDADREFHWYAVYGKRALLLKSIESYSRNKQENLFTDREYEDYFFQLNKHLSNLVKLPMKDKKNRSKRYFYFGVIAKRYRVIYGNYLTKKHNVNYYFEPDSEYIKNLKKQFELFLQLREITKLNSPKTYEAFAAREDDWWLSMQRYILGATHEIIRADMARDQLNCSSPFIQNFCESRQKILLYGASDSRSKISNFAKEFISTMIYNNHLFSYGTTFKLIKEKCNTPDIQAFEEYPQRIREINNVSN